MAEGPQHCLLPADGVHPWLVLLAASLYYSLCDFSAVFALPEGPPDGTVLRFVGKKEKKKRKKEEE